MKVPSFAFELGDKVKLRCGFTGVVMARTESLRRSAWPVPGLVTQA